MVRPALAPAPVVVAASHASNTASAARSLVPHREFRWDPQASLSPAPDTSTDFAVDAPPTLGPGIGGGGATNSIGSFIPNIVAAPPPAKPAPSVQKQPAAPLAVGGDVQMAKLLRKVTPLYPPLARSARISGVVRLIGTIGKDGTIRDLELISGHPLLARAAMEAVEQWVYKPTLLNGNPVEVIAPIEVRFTLGQ